MLLGLINGNLLISPKANKNGILEVALSAYDGEFNITKEINITINSVNDIPVFLNNSDTIEKFEDTNKTGKFIVGSVIVEESMDLMALTNSGKMIRVDMQSISKSRRNTSGVYIIKGDDVQSIARCPKEQSEPDTIEDEMKN